MKTFSLLCIKPQAATFAALATVVALWGAGGAFVAHAEIHKCTEADGKVLFSDRPCERGQAAATIKSDAAAAPKAVPRGKAPAESDPQTADLRTRIDEVLSPECRAMQQRVSDSQAPGAKALTELELESIVETFKARCGSQVDAVMRKQSEKKRIAAETAASCDAKRKVLKERALQRPSMKPAQRGALDAVQKEVDLECR